jgi:hypothetical protein
MGIETICTTAIASNLLREMAEGVIPDERLQRILDYTHAAKSA